jgi:ubiquinol-cytochrome c reductase cytochrome c1 subunit
MPIKKLATLLVAVCVSFPLIATASEGESYPHAGNDPYSQASLQRGARNFMNYCSGCHSAKFVRYNRIAKDLGIPEAELKANLMFTSDKTADTIKSAMSPEDARQWFGNAPPDLSLIARSRGTDHVYAYLTSFYRDPSRPTGVNNTVLPGTAMPHVLADLQGVQTAVFKRAEGGGVPEFERFELAEQGSMSPDKFQEFVRDTVNFLEYMAEPVQTTRRDLGVWVILFLLVFTGFAYLLYKEFWRDVH